MISIEMLPAAHGDSLWIEYGSARQTRRILIDGGPAHTYEAGLRNRIASLPKDKRNCELMVVTHIDADHIDGAIILLQDNDTNRLNFQIKELWFNGWDQLSKFKSETFAPLQGEFLGGLLTLNPKLRSVWNQRFAKGPVVVADTGPLLPTELTGKAKITLLGPTATELRRLRARWDSAIRDFAPGDVKEAMRRLKKRRDYKPPASPAIFQRGNMVLIELRPTGRAFHLFWNMTTLGFFWWEMRTRVLLQLRSVDSQCRNLLSGLVLTQ